MIPLTFNSSAHCHKCKRRVVLRPVGFLPKDSPCNLAKELWRHLKPPKGEPNHSANNIQQLLDKPKGIKVDDEVELTTDFRGPFTSIGVVPDRLLQRNHRDNPLETI